MNVTRQEYAEMKAADLIIAKLRLSVQTLALHHDFGKIG